MYYEIPVCIDKLVAPKGQFSVHGLAQ